MAGPHIPPLSKVTDDPRWPPQIGEVNSVPIYGYGELFVYGLPPDFQPGNEMQVGNRDERRKIRPKKSWEIKSNYFGATPPRVPRTAHMDYQFNLPVNLIDGEPETCWVSRGQPRPDQQPEWIRIDLAQETTIREVVLLTRARPLPERGFPDYWDLGPDARYVSPMPRRLTVKVSRDEWHWETVYETADLPHRTETGAEIHLQLEPCRAKQLWLMGEEFGLLHRGPYSHWFTWCLAGVQVLDEEGHNVALASRGAGVTTSSTWYDAQGRRQEMDDWWPLHYDLGLKWLRVNFHNSVLIWHYVEQKKGEYVIDPRADTAITEAASHGINVIMGLMYGNWLYADRPQPNFVNRVQPMPFDSPPAPQTEEQIEAYLNYVSVMVNHFKGRVKIWEIWNEPDQDLRYGWGPEGRKTYGRIFRRAKQIIAELDPSAKVLLTAAGGSSGSPEYDPTDPDFGVKALEPDVVDYIRFYEEPLDGPMYRSYPERFKDFRRRMEAEGFKGIYLSEENQWWGSPAPDFEADPVHGVAHPELLPYPLVYDSDTPLQNIMGVKILTSEIGQAKNLARTMMMHCGLGVVSFWNETWNTALSYGDVGLLRYSFHGGPAHAASCRPAYYVYRTLCTVMDGAEPVEKEVVVAGSAEVYDCYTFEGPQGEVLVAVWLPGNARDTHPGERTQVTLPGMRARSVVGVDLLNGDEQEIAYTSDANGTVVPDLLVRDYPLVLLFIA